MGNNYGTLLYRIYHWLATIPPKIKWGKETKITDEQRDEIAKTLASGYYIILTGSSHHLSSVIVSFLTWVKTGKWGRYSHVLMNCDNIESADQRDDFKFVEATAKGVDYATFDEVFDCDCVCLLTPANITNEKWTAIIDALVNEVGLPYDDLFNLADSSHLSCVEVVLDALATADLSTNFSNLSAMIKQKGNLVPEMYRDCSDFTVTLEL